MKMYWGRKARPAFSGVWPWEKTWKASQEVTFKMAFGKIRRDSRNHLALR